jgi:hypothetical protein
MKLKAKTIGISAAVSLVLAIVAYYIAPLSAWRKGSSITIYPAAKQNVNVYNPVSYNSLTCTYSAFCLAWWKTKFMKRGKITDPDFTYDGGVLDEITIKPSN